MQSVAAQAQLYFQIFSRRIHEHTTLSAALLACVLFAGPVAAAQSDKAATPSPDAAFQQLDTNHDNRISKEEARRMEGLQEAYGSADANRDGALDQKEFRALLDSAPAK
jgi:outer membrane murein-binding lipoprotein Lpp